MKRETWEEAKKTLEEISKILKEETLTTEERQKLETHVSQLAGVLSRPLLPFSWSRRLIMIVLAVVGLYGLVQGNNYLLLAWLLLPLFSPYFATGIAGAIGIIFRGVGWR